CLTFLEESCALPLCGKTRPDEMQMLLHAKNGNDPYVSMHFYIDVGLKSPLWKDLGEETTLDSCVLVAVLSIEDCKK
ncbi:hypothetical protein A2U01_0054787, partial [Trifolium medium]|nr:hypothetical protein [Trifolium medium]